MTFIAATTEARGIYTRGGQTVLGYFVLGDNFSGDRISSYNGIQNTYS